MAFRKETAEKIQQLKNQKLYGGTGRDITIQRPDGSEVTYAPGSEGYANFFKPGGERDRAVESSSAVVELNEQNASVEQSSGSGSRKFSAAELKDLLDEGTTIADQTVNQATLSNTKLEAYKELIQDNPPEFSDEINKLKKTFPEELGNITTVDPDKLSELAKGRLFSRLESYRQNNTALLPPQSLATGMEIILADPTKDNFFAETEAQVSNFFKLITSAGDEIINFPSEIKSVVGSVSDLSKGFISQIGNALTDKMVTFVQKGLTGLKQFFLATIPEKLTALATTIRVQTALMNPVKIIMDKLGCLVGNAAGAVKGAIEDMLTGMVRNLINTPVCAAQQFVGGLVHKITNVIDSLVGPFVGPIESLMSPIGAVFKIKDTIMGGLGIANKLANLFKCNEETPTVATSKYVIDGGERKDQSDKEQESSISKAFNAANNAAGRIKSAKDGLLGGIEGKLSSFEEQYGEFEIFGSKLASARDQGIGDCSNTGNEFNCGMPSIEFFGGDGIGAAGKVLMGSFINKFDKEDILGDIERVGSIIGVEMTNRGQAYTEPPLVAFTDSCDKGYGAYGQAVIDYNQNSPTFGQVIAVTITAQGQNYPIPEEEDLYIREVIVEQPGEGYVEGDTIDDFEICGVDSLGGITCVKSPDVPYRELPRINFNVGTGAVLRPVMTREIPQTEVVQVIDCVT